MDITGYKFVRLLVIAWSCTAITPGLAAEDDDTGWRFTVSAGIELEPGYTGSDVYNTEADVNFEAVYTSERGDEYFIGLGEIGTRRRFDPDWSLFAKLEFEEGRENSDDEVLREFAEVEDTIEGQFTLVRKLDEQWRAAVVLQPDLLSRGKGVVYFLALQNEQTFLDKATLVTTLDVSFGDSDHMNTEFGVTAADAAASGLRAFDADSGLKSTSASFGIYYPIRRNVGFIADIGLEYYLADTVDSPLIKDEGTEFNYELEIGLQYEF